MIIFLVLSEKMVFFSKSMIWKRKMTENERWSFSKNTWTNDNFCIIGKDAISFSYKYDLLPKKYT